MAPPLQNLVYPVSLLIITTLCFLLGHSITEFWWTDEARHAMDGVFILDFMRDLPFGDVRGYLEEYFARFPALGFTWYLPFYAFVEAVFFGLFGVGMTAAKLTMWVFWCLTAVSMFYWGCQDQRRTFALVAVCLLFSNYYFLLWGRAIMLEVPALAMMLLFVLSAQRYFSNSTFVNSLLLGVIGFCMLMTKQTVLFILPVVLLIGVINYQWRNWLTLKIIPATVLVSCGLAGIAAHALVIGKSGFGQVTQSAGGGLASYLFSSLPNAISVMYEHYGPWMLALALLGAIVGIRNGDRRAIAVYLAWIVAGILFLAFLSNIRGNLLRYGIYLAPPIYLLVVQAVQLPTSNKRLSYIWYALCFGLFSFSFFNAYSVGYPTLDGYEESADFVSDLPNGPIMFCCKHDGNFTFYMRRNDPQRRSLILRADKILVSIVINVSRGVVEHAESVDDIRKLLDRNFVRYLVLEDRTLQQVGQFERLRRFAESDSFKKLNTNQVTSSLPAFDGLKIAVYEYLDVPESTGGEVSIPFPHLGRTIILGID